MPNRAPRQHTLRAVRARAADEDGFTLVAAMSVMVVLLLVGAATIALANTDVQQVPRNRNELRAQLAAESGLDAAQYRMAKTAGGLLGKSGGGSLVSLANLNEDLANLLCIQVDLQTGTPLLDVGNQNAGVCPPGPWEALGDGTRMQIRQQQLGVLKPGEIVSRKVVGIGEAQSGGRTTTRRMIMRVELKLDDAGNLSLIRRRGVALCQGGYDPADPFDGCPTPSSPPTSSTAGNDTPFTVPPPTAPEPAGDGTPRLMLVPHIDGTPEEQETLTVVPGQWRHVTGDATRRYDWYRCKDSCTVVKSTTAADAATTYGPLTQSNHGDDYSWVVRETVTNNPGKTNEKSVVAWSLGTLRDQQHGQGCTGLPVAGLCLGNGYRIWSVSARTPRITGSPRVGQTLTVDDAKSWVSRSDESSSSKVFALIDLSGGGVTRTWYRCAAVGSNVADASAGGSVAGAGCDQVGTGATRQVVAADVGKRLVARTTVSSCGSTLLGLVCLSKATNAVVTRATARVTAN